MGPGDADPLARVDLYRHQPQDEMSLSHNGIIEARNDRTRTGRGSDGELEDPFLAGMDAALSSELGHGCATAHSSVDRFGIDSGALKTPPCTYFLAAPVTVATPD